MLVAMMFLDQCERLLILLMVGLFAASVCFQILGKSVDVTMLIEYDEGDLDDLVMDCHHMARLILVVLLCGRLIKWITGYCVIASIISFAVLVALWRHPDRRLAGGRLRTLLGKSLLRSVNPSLQSSSIKFVDVIVGDVWTSYARITADVMVELLVWWSAFVRFLVISLPFLVRLKQCVVDYQSSLDRRMIFNAIKYSTSFPIYFGNYLWMTRRFRSHNLWSFCYWMTVLNSSYTSFWDLFMDWNFLAAVKRQSWTRSLSMVVLGGINAVLRFSWLLALQQRSLSTEVSLFSLEFMEVIRRIVWLYFRTISEHHRSASTTIPL